MRSSLSIVSQSVRPHGPLQGQTWGSSKRVHAASVTFWGEENSGRKFSFINYKFVNTFVKFLKHSTYNYLILTAKPNLHLFKTFVKLINDQYFITDKVKVWTKSWYWFTLPGYFLGLHFWGTNIFVEWHINVQLSTTF